MSRTLGDKPVESFWCYCDGCDVSITVKAQSKSHPMPPEEAWDNTNMICPVCGEWLEPEEMTFAEAGAA